MEAAIAARNSGGRGEGGVLRGLSVSSSERGASSMPSTLRALVPGGGGGEALRGEEQGEVTGDSSTWRLLLRFTRGLLRAEPSSGPPTACMRGDTWRGLRDGRTGGEREKEEEEKKEKKRAALCSPPCCAAPSQSSPWRR